MRKKLIGTGILAILLLAGLLASGSSVFAQFIQSSNSLIIDGVVSSVGASSFSVSTSGANPVTITVDSRTVFPGNGLALAGISFGDRVSVIARGTPSPVARIVRKLSGVGYGTSGDRIIFNTAVVTAKTANSFTVNTGTTLATFQVTPSTVFARVNFSTLAVGNTIQVIGTDAGTGFRADLVNKRF